MLCWHHTAGLWAWCKTWLLLGWNFKALCLDTSGLFLRFNLKILAWILSFFLTWPQWCRTSWTSSIETSIRIGKPLCIRFVSQGDRTIPSFSVRYLDRFCKGLICQAIAAIVDKLEPRLHWDDKQPPHVTTHHVPTGHALLLGRGHSGWGARQWRPGLIVAELALFQSQVQSHDTSRGVLYDALRFALSRGDVRWWNWWFSSNWLLLNDSYLYSWITHPWTRCWWSW